MRVANAVMLVLFLFSVAVQYNDPDPLTWMAIYLAAAIVCVLELMRRTPRWLPLLVAAIAVTWAATIAPRVVGKVRFLDMFSAFEMKDIHVEESREMYGLLLITSWMILVSVSSRTAGRRPVGQSVRQQ